MSGLEHGTWVLVADGEKALFLVNNTDSEDPYLEVRREKHQDNPPDREQGTDRPGRFNDGGPNQRSAFDETDFHRLEKERFADDLVEMLYKSAHKGEFSKLVLVAPPRTLGEMRAKMHKEVSDKVVAEIDKTLTNHPIDEIEKLVKAELDAAA
ncbi:host attachment protein [Silicimonas algicola]|uniref:Protein required for attachment to host cells n=1 Tax=Silicimonas algicola TaxID=1826607 RepID=A0A316G870_9RHOB|nr:host attachment family protein [Silicimonas algicola]AZQ67471.1 host attachment protein [Silicimonas algicola]PWK57161.1 protein required for attachment to host cells [Silicimonas algicola]